MVPRDVVQTIFVEATEQVKEKRSVLPHSHRQISFKHFYKKTPMQAANLTGSVRALCKNFLVEPVILVTLAKQ